VDVVRAVGEARAGGIASVSLDLLYDVPEASLNDWIETLEAALALEPDHLSLYALTLDDPDAEGLTGPGGDHLPTRIGARRWRADARSRQDEDRAAAEYHHAVHRLAEDGWHGYEISNWARPGHESRHNQAYWERRSYEAVGPGAHAFDGVTRRWNAARLDGYVAALTPAAGRVPGLPPGGSEAVDPATAAAETVILGLRTSRGVPLAAANEPPLDEAFGWALAAELLEATHDDRIVLTTRGRLLSNELFSRLV
jgi:oxygen-independent coproporphyrinogen-3 oxidase